MIFDLDESQEGEWFPFFLSRVDPKSGEVIYDDPVSDARVRVRSPKGYLEEVASKRKKAWEYVLNPKTRQMERSYFYPMQSPEDLKAEREDLVDYAITGLENFKDKKTGDLIECTRENKIRLMKNTVFDRFIGRCWELLENSAFDSQEKETKNS